MNNTPLIDRPLSEMQQRFAEEYCIDFCKGKAAIRAGYSDKNAYKEGFRLANDPRIKAYINEFLGDLTIDTKGIIATNVEYWTSLRGDTDEDTKDRLKASELLGKSAAMFTEKKEVITDLTINNISETAKMTDEQLRKIVSNS